MTEETPPTPPSTPTPPSDTPIGDELAARQQEVAPDATKAAAPVEQAPTPAETVAPANSATDPAAEQPDEDDEGEGTDEDGDAGPKTAKSYKVDVKRALKRETDDGPGDEDPGESDFVSYATDGVEVED